MLLIRNIMVGAFLLVLFTSMVISIASVARLRGFLPEIYVFNQSPTLLGRLSDSTIAACIDEFDDKVCAHLDYVRQVGDERFEIITHVSASRALQGRFGENRIVVSKVEAVLRDDRLCLPDLDTKEELFFYVSDSGAVKPDAPLKALDQANQQLFREKMGFAANGWDCLEYVEAPDWLAEGGILRRGFKDNLLSGVSRRVRLVASDQPLALSTR